MEAPEDTVPRVANGFLYKAVSCGEATNVFMLRRGFSLMGELQTRGTLETLVSLYAQAEVVL